MPPRQTQRGHWHETAYLGALIVLAPLWFPLFSVRDAIGRMRWRRSHEVRSLVLEGEAFVVDCTTGPALRIDLAGVRDAVEGSWGDGIDGSEYEAWITVDGLRLRAAHVTLAPLRDALVARGILRQGRWWGRHPLDRGRGLTTMVFALGIVVDAILVGGFFVAIAVASVAALNARQRSHRARSVESTNLGWLVGRDGADGVCSGRRRAIVCSKVIAVSRRVVQRSAPSSERDARKRSSLAPSA